MSEVFFSKSIDKIIENIELSVLGKNVAIKIHFGELGCTTFINPEIVKKVYDKIISTGRKASLVECNTLYKGSRTNSTNHIRVAVDHGFGFAPIDILDGEEGKDFVEITIGDFTAKIGEGLKKYDSMVVISHFKGHIYAGFGGAIKNVGMGLGSRAGKLHMHSDTKPLINENCIGCGICIKNCNSDAITLEHGKANINQEKCTGCAMCIAVCPNKAVEFSREDATGCGLQKKMALYAKAVMEIIPKDKIIFINVLENITPLCDCKGVRQEPIMDDVGILMSKDIVSIDAASLDLANKFSNGKFDKINPVDKKFQIECAEKIGLGEMNYSIINCGSVNLL